MAHHLIFISRDNLQGIKTAEQLAAVGLADHGQGALTAPSEGPEGHGTLYGWVPNRLHYNANEQEWFPAVPNGDMPGKRYWVGVWKDSPVKEQDLRRPYRYGGVNIELGDGERWLVPRPKELPQDAILADDGTWKFELQRRFHDYGLEVDGWVEKYNSGLIDVGYEELLRFGLKALALNYRLTPELVSQLRLFNKDVIGRVFCAAIGAPVGDE